MQQKPRLARGLSQEKRFFGFEADQSEQQYHQQHQPPSSYPYQSCWEANMDGSIEPHENDVLMGRGGLNNKHSGNERLRQLARQYGGKYKSLTKKEKSDLSRYLVRRMRELDPPARFLKRIQQTASWEEVGDDIAREKASQVLRDAVSGLLDDRKPSADAGEDSTNDSTTGIGVALVPTVSAQTSTDMEEHDYSESSPQHSASSSRQHHHRLHQPYEPTPHAASTMMMPSQVPSSSPYSPVPYPPYHHSQQQHQHHHHYPLQHHSSPPPYQLLGIHPSSALPPPPPPLLPPLDSTAQTPPLERKRRRHYAAEAAPPPPPPVPHAIASSASADGPMIRRYHSDNTYLTVAQQQQQQHLPPRRPVRAARQRSANSTDEMGQLLAGELLESDSEDDAPSTVHTRSA